MRTWLERLGEEVNELLRIDEFGKCMRSGLDEAENLLCSHYCEIREWQVASGNRTTVERKGCSPTPPGHRRVRQPPSNIRYRTALAPGRASQPSHAGTIALPLPTLDRGVAHRNTDEHLCRWVDGKGVGAETCEITIMSEVAHRRLSISI